MNSAADAVAARVCAACAGPKTPGFAFCRTDHLALTALQRAQIAKGPSAFARDDAEFAEAYLAALAHLRAHPVRKKIVGDGWAYASPIELREAGYEFLNDGHCGAPRCSREIWWFRTPQGGRVAVNAGHRQHPKPFDWQPHRVSCADPGYWERVKQRQEERRKLRRRKRAAVKAGVKTSSVQTFAGGAR